jgi:hypothetical protein
MLVTDSRDAWDAQRLPAARAQYWDGDRIIARWLAAAGVGGTSGAGVVWDAWFAFDRDARWLDRPTHLLGAGSPVTSSTDALAQALARA